MSKLIIPGVVSVILVNYRGVEDTIAAVEGVLASDWHHSLREIVVVDNASGDDSVARLKAAFPNGEIVLVESKQNLGFAGGCNLGAQHAKGEYLAFLNNDARPDDKWIAAAVETFASGHDIGAVASKVLDWEGERVDFVGAAVTWYGMGYKPHAGETDNHRWDDERDVLFGTGAAMFVRAALFAEVGGFDEDYFMFYEDVDLGWRLNLLGHRVRYQPKSVAYHKHHQSIEKYGAYREEYLLERNALYTLYKNLDDESLAEVLPGSILLAVRRAVGRGKLDSTSLDLSKPGGDDVATAEVPKSTLAGVYGIDQFIEKLPEMTAKRAQLQAARKLTDRHLKLLFGEVDEPAFPIDSYLRGYDKIVDALGMLSMPGVRRVLVVTGDPIGPRMAGPGIRAWNMAALLSRENEVRLVSSNKTIAGTDEHFTIHHVPLKRPQAMAPHEEWADIIVVQGHALEQFPALEASNKILIVDIYDPMHLEQLEQGRGLSLKRWNEQIAGSNEALNHQLLLGDFFLCASERQRLFWLGQLAALGRVNAHTYSRDTSLSSLLAVVPFGMPDDEPVKTRSAIRDVVPGIGADDKVIVWAGGIYNWFDPETLISAVGQLAETHDNVRLYFMGVKHPNPNVPEMEAVGRARSLAAKLGILGSHVFFNEGWVDYDDRVNYLLDADLGVSTHFEHVETTFSFRTRILDYLWAGLPIVSTRGDSFAEFISDHGLGGVVRERDVDGLAAAIEKLLYDDEVNAATRERVAVAREEFRWERVLEPLVAFVRQPAIAADKVPGSEPVRSKDLAASARARSRHTGLRRDIDRVVYYLKNGGPSAVMDRLKARRERIKNAAS